MAMAFGSFCAGKVVIANNKIYVFLTGVSNFVIGLNAAIERNYQREKFLSAQNQCHGMKCHNLLYIGRECNNQYVLKYF